MWEYFIYDNAWFAKQLLLPPKEGQEKPEIIYFPLRKGKCNHPKGTHAKKDCPDVKHEIFTKAHLLEHLQGKSTFAPYQLSKDNKVKWLCLDIDGRESKEMNMSFAISLHKEVEALLGQNTCLIEDSGSKGYHLWIFFDNLLPAGYAVSLGHMLSQRLSIPKGVGLEVYPKQASRKLLGNTVKLPLGVHRKTGNRCMFVTIKSDKLVEAESAWEALKKITKVSSQAIMTRFEEFEEDRPRDRTLPEDVPLCLMEILDKGIEPGFKDEPVFKLSCYLNAKGFPEWLTRETLHVWNNKNTHPIAEDVLERKIDSAYEGDYSYLPCASPLFDHICKSTCPFFNNKKRIRWKDKEKSPLGVICRE